MTQYVLVPMLNNDTQRRNDALDRLRSMSMLKVIIVRKQRNY